MKHLFPLFLAAVICAVPACKSDDSSVTEESNSQEASNAPTTVDNMSWTFLTEGIYHNNATVTIGQPIGRNPNEGHWINFMESGDYEYGVWDERTYSGKWTYDNNSKLLELIPEGEHMPSEWQVMHKDDKLILVGTAKYSNNSQQMRYIRHAEKPSKSDQ